MTTLPVSRVSELRASWDGDPPLRSAARQRLIEAATRCIVRDGFDATRVSSVAAEAGVSRPTVYRYFPDRRALLLATVLHAGRSLGDDLRHHLRAFREKPRRMAVEAVVYVLGEVPRNRLLAALWGSKRLDAAMLAEFTRPEVVAIARDATADLARATGWSGAEADEAVEWMLRVLLSLLVAPAPERSEAALRSLLERRLLPALPPIPRSRSRSNGENR